MKRIIIFSGSFTANGNFSGYSILGERVHCYDRQMKAIGLDADTLKFPIFAIAQEKEFSSLDADGKETGKFKRLTATALFAEKATMIEAYKTLASLEREISDAVQQELDGKLSDEAINLLQGAI